MFSLTLLDHLRLTFSQISQRHKAHAAHNASAPRIHSAVDPPTTPSQSNRSTICDPVSINIYPLNPSLAA